MTTLLINGKKVTVSENFMSLTPEEQNRTVDEIARSPGFAEAGKAAGPLPGMSYRERASKSGGVAAGPTFSPEQQAAIDAARSRLNAAKGPGVAAGTTFSPEQQAAIDRARARLDAAKSGQAPDGAPASGPWQKYGKPDVKPWEKYGGQNGGAAKAAANAGGAENTAGIGRAGVLPPNPELMTRGPGPTGVISPDLYEMGAIGRRFVEGQPGGMTLDEGLSSLSETWRSPPEPISQGRAGLAAASQGATFGFADEIGAGLLSLHPQINYDDALGHLRAEVDTARESFPKTALAGEIAGAVAMPGRAAASFVNKGKGTLDRMVRGAVAGGGAGAVAGYGTGEGGAEERGLNSLSTGALGALGGGALVGLGQGFNKVLGLVSKRPELREVAPTLAGLRDDAAKLYSEARDSGAVMPATEVGKMVAGIQDTLRNVGFDTDLHPRVSAVLKRLTSEAGDKGLADVEILRRVASNAAESISPDERRLAGIVIDKIDDAIDGLGEGGAAMKSARETWGRLRRMETIEAAIERAGLAKANFASALQSEFRTLVKNPRKMRGFSAAERAQMVKIARGGPVTASLQALGAALSPSRPLGAVIAGGTAYGFGPAALALPATGMAATKIAEAIAKRSGRKVAGAIGSSDARRATIEALVKKPNKLAASVPAAGYVPGALGMYLSGQ